jgi:hypothetical protein
MNTSARATPCPGRRASVAVLVLSALAAAPAWAQLASEGKGTMTLEVGQASGPFGNIAAQTVDRDLLDHPTLHQTAFRLLAGYHFAEQLSIDVGLADLGNFKSSAPYAGTDTLKASSQLVIVEGELVARIPVTPNSRVDLTGGVCESGLNTSISTQNGSALPVGSSSSENVRRFGVTAGLDVEWRLSDVTSVILGYHLYTHVGSGAALESASGNASALFGGMHFEF